MYQATFEARFLEAALGLAEDMIGRFGDEQDGRIFLHAPRSRAAHCPQQGSARQRDPFRKRDGGRRPLRLSQLCGRTDMENWAQRTLVMLSGEMARVSMAVGQALLALDDLLGPAYEIVIVEGPSRQESDQVLRRAPRPLPAGQGRRPPSG